jgi:hypothetical protein
VIAATLVVLAALLASWLLRQKHLRRVATQEAT